MNLFNTLAANCNLLSNPGDIDIQNIAKIITYIVTFVPVVIAVLVIVFGMLDLGKAVAAQKEEDIKKSQGMLIKRVIVSVLVFFVVAIVKLVVGVAAGDNKKTEILNCIDFFINQNL